MSESTTSRFSKNIWSLTVSQIVFRLATIVVFGYIGRVLGVSVLGQYGIVMTVLNFYISFSDLGITNFVIKEVSQDRSLGELYLNNFFALQIVLGVVIVGLALLTGEVSGYSQVIMWGLGIGSIGLVFNGMANAYKALLSAQERLFPFAIIEIVCVIVYVIGNLTVILLREGVLALIAVTVAVQITKYVAGALWAHKYNARVRLNVDPKIIKSMVWMGLPFLLYNSAYFAVQRIDLLLIGALGSETSSGIYTAASRLVYSSLFVISVFGTALYPVLSRMYQENQERVRELYYQSTGYVYIVGCFITLMFFLLAPYLLHLIFGAAFTDSITVFRIITWYIPVFALRLIPGNMLMVGDKVWSAARVSVAGVAAMVVLVVVLYPYFGINGVAVIVVGVESLLTVVYFLMVWRIFKFSFMKMKAVQTTAVLLVSIGAFLLIPQQMPVLQILLPAALFIGLIFATKVLLKADMTIILNILIKRPSRLT